MGVAAYARGSHIISAQLSSTQRDPLFMLMERLNALPKYYDAGHLSCQVTICYSNNVWWVQGPKGAAGFGYWYRSLHEAIKRWHITMTEYDVTTGIWKGIPCSPGTPKPIA